MQGQPISPTREPNLGSLGALEAPTIAPLSLTRDPPWNPLSSGAASETRNQIAPWVQSIVPHDQHTFTAVIAQPLDFDTLQSVNNNRRNSSKQNDDPRIEGARPPNAALNNQGTQQSYGLFINPASGLDETSQGNSQTTQKFPYESQVDNLAAQQVDNLHKRLSVGNTNLIARGQELSVLEQPRPSGNTPSNESVDLRTLEGLSSRSTETGTPQNPRIDDVEGDLEHLGALLRRLNIQPSTVYHKAILKTCEEIRERAPHSTAVGEAQRSPVTSASATSSTSENRTQSSTRSNRRPRPQGEDSDSEQQGLKKQKTAQFDCGSEGPVLSCLFYKVNPHIYSTCADFKGNSITRLGDHLKKRHTGDFHCHDCCRLFKTELQRSAHQANCRPTRGKCVCEILPLSKTQGVNATERWWGAWIQLFPTLRKPRDPWWSETIIVEQISLANLKKIWEAASNGGTNLSMNNICDILSDWHTTPPDHLPDLQVFQSEIIGRLANSDQGRQHRVLEAPPQATHTPRASESAESQTDGQNLDVAQTHIESTPPILDERTKKVDSDAEIPNSQSGLSGILTSPHNYVVSQQNNDSNFDFHFHNDIELDMDYIMNLDFDFGLSQTFENEETQTTLEAHPTTGYTTDPLRPGDDPHVGVGEMDRLNPNSDNRETTPVEEDAPWEPEKGFFDLAWPDYEEDIMPT